MENWWIVDHRMMDGWVDGLGSPDYHDHGHDHHHQLSGMGLVQRAATGIHSSTVSGALPLVVLLGHASLEGIFVPCNATCRFHETGGCSSQPPSGFFHIRLCSREGEQLQTISMHIYDTLRPPLPLPSPFTQPIAGLHRHRRKYPNHHRTKQGPVMDRSLARASERRGRPGFHSCP